MSPAAKTRLNSPAARKQGAGGPAITISDRQSDRKISQRTLKRITAATLAELKIEGAELGIILIGATGMAALNRQFLGHEGPTDVITFDYHSLPSTVRDPKVPQAAVGLRGEIFVCVSEAVRQSKIFQTDWRSEVARYVVHGILHLAGHDDLQPAARRKMKRVENRLMRKSLKGAMGWLP